MSVHCLELRIPVTKIHDLLRIFRAKEHEPRFQFILYDFILMSFSKDVKRHEDVMMYQVHLHTCVGLLYKSVNIPVRKPCKFLSGSLNQYDCINRTNRTIAEGLVRILRSLISCPGILADCQV